MDSRITAGLDARKFDHIVDKHCIDDKSEPAFAKARAARKQLTDGASRLHDARQALVQDMTRTDADRARLLDDTVKSVTSKATQGGAEAERMLRERAKKSRHVIEESIKNAVPNEAAEIRAYLRNLGERERASFIRQAIANGDTETGAAVLAAKPYLSGLNETEVKELRGNMESRFAPDEVKVREAAEAAAEEIGQAANLFYREADSVNDPRAAQVAAQQRAFSEQALKAAESLEPTSEPTAEPEPSSEESEEADTAES